MFSSLQIRTKLALVMTLLLAIVSIAIYIYFPEKLQRQAIGAMTEQARAVADMTAFSIAAPLQQRDNIAVVEALTGLRRNRDLVYFTLRDTTGKVVTSFNEDVATNTRVRPSQSPQWNRSVGMIGTPGETTGAFSVDGGKVYQTITPVRYHGRAVGSLAIGFSVERALVEAERSRMTVAFVTLLAFGIGVVAIFALSSFITGPLERIVHVAEHIAAGATSSRADVHAEDEVGQLARSFNKMLDTLDGTRAELEDLNRTLEKRVEERALALRESEERYRLLFDRNLAGVYIARSDGRVIACNEACARMFGFESTEDFLAQHGVIAYADQARRESMLQRLQDSGAISNEEAELRTPDGKSVWALENVRLVPAADGADATLEGILLDVTDRKRAEQEIAYKAFHDLLTGLPNRVLFFDHLQIAIAQAERKRRSLAVLFFDLDNLKAVNDGLGHAMGDTILKMVGRRLALTVRQTDTVARIGGDEFLILLTDVTDEATAQAVAEKHLATIRNPFLIDNDEVHLTTSVGLAMYPQDGNDADSLIRNADGAMYRAKASGGNRVELSSRATVPTVGRSDLEQEIRAALDRDEFVVVYQPQVSINDRRLVGVEALVRWNHPQRGLVPPIDFIGTAEQSGLIVSLGEIVLRKACEQAAAWRQNGYLPARLSVNVSPRQMYQRNFVGMVERVLAETTFDGAFLELELTEGITMQKSDRSIRMLERLRDRGVSIAVDDFGTGQSSISYLKEFPVDTVKIDKSFVVDITRRANDQSIVRALLFVANQLGLRTIAEGVETEEQCTFLREQGCGEIQGYLISKPISAAELEAKFLERGAPAPSPAKNAAVGGGAPPSTTPSDPRADEPRAFPPADLA